MNSAALALAAGDSTRAERKGYKWISKEIDRLDPEVDYARIWALSTMYYADDTLVNLLYSLGMPCFTQSPYGSELLINRTRKAMDKAHDRANDTLSHFWHWFHYGPEHIEAQRSIEQVNRIHGAMWTLVEEAFTNDDFNYTVSWLATKLHRIRLATGMPGWTAKQKIAAHHFWQGVVVKMRGPFGDVRPIPASFEEMEAFVDEFESRDWGQVESGYLIGQYSIRQFNEARLPKAAWGLGRQLILTFQSPRIRQLHRMGEPNPIAAYLIRKGLKFKIWMDEQVLPDPKTSAHERAIQNKDVAGQHREPRMAPASACPFHGGQATGVRAAE